MMEKITKKKFFGILEHTENILIDGLYINSDYIRKYGWNDGKLEASLNAVESDIVRKNPNDFRSVKENHATYLRFSDGSRLYNNQSGKHEYYYCKRNGNSFLILKRIVWDQFDEMENYKYIVYVIK